jgi:hypothetical protein
MKKILTPNYTETRITVWGQSLGSLLGFARLNKIKRSMYDKFTPFLRSVIIGLILGDSWLEKNGINARLGFSQSIDKFYYFFSVYFILAPFCSSLPKLRIRINKGKKYYALEFKTISLPCFTEILSLFYINKVKVIPLEIFNLLDAIALAHWICCDGGFNKNGLYLCTDSFSLKDVIFLLNVLNIKFGLDCTIQKTQKGAYRIYIKKGSMSNLQSILIPYLPSTMLYKIHM